jgi:hypothetical protein
MKTRNAMKRSSLIVAMLALIAGTEKRAEAGTILSVVGNNEGAFTIGGLAGGGGFSQVVGASWTQTGSYTDVAIAAFILENGGSDTINAYLVRGSVPQPVTSEVAHTSFNVNNGLSSPTIFMGLTLGPGTYTLVLASSTELGNTMGWEDSSAPTIQLDTGVSLNFKGYTSFDSSPPAYAPNDPNFLPQNGSAYLDYIVTGTAVPEPSSFVLAGTALMGLAGTGLWRRKAKG